MANTKNSTGKYSTSKNSSSNKTTNSSSNGTPVQPTKKIPSFTSLAPGQDDRERRDGPGGE
jgi:hypothetical protein